MSRDKVTIRLKGKTGEVNKIKTVNKKTADDLIKNRRATLVKGISSAIKNIDKDLDDVKKDIKNLKDKNKMRTVLNGTEMQR